MKNILLALLLTVSLPSFSQEPIFATIAGGDLYAFNLENCTRRFIGSTGQGFGDIAFTPNGELWGIVGGELYQIDTATANATLVGSTGLEAVSLVGLNDSTLLAESGAKLYKIHTTDASFTYVDTIGYQAAGDLTWYDDDLYIVTSSEPIIRIVLNSSITAILSVTPIGISAPTCEGAVTASFDGEYNSIVGFSGPNLIKICQIDASVQKLCPDLNIGGTPGAASLRLPTQSPVPESCEKTNSLEASPSGHAFSIFPNPATSQLNIEVTIDRNGTFSIYNALGQRIKTGDLGGNTTTLEINDWIDGVYYIEVSVDAKTERQRFVVKR